MRRMTVLVVVLALSACSPSDGGSETAPESTEATTTSTLPDTTTTTTVPPDFGVSTPAFDDGAAIPVEYTCDGEDVSPELVVVGIPEETQTLTVIVDDHDAPLGIWTHWVEFNVAPQGGSLEVPRDAGNIGVAGSNSWRLEGYMGPCPPEGEEHTYFFEIYALGATLDLPSGVDADAVRDAMEGDIIDMVETTGTYGR